MHLLALVEVMKDHYALRLEKSIPLVAMNQPVDQQLKEHPNQRVQEPKYAVVNVEDILYQVGLIQSLKKPTVFKVIAPYMVFKENMVPTAGQIKYI